MLHILLLILTIAAYNYDYAIVDNLTSLIFIVSGFLTLPYSILSNDLPSTENAHPFHFIIMLACIFLLYHTTMFWAFIGSILFLLAMTIVVLRQS